MLRSEFEILTGIYVDEEMMVVINDRYNAFEGDKREFCKAYKENLNGLAQSIQMEANRRMLQKYEDSVEHNKELLKQISELREKLDKELEWEPHQMSAMNDADYEKLKQCGRLMTKEDAKGYIAMEFGFQKERIVVYDTIPVYRKNRHGAIKKFSEQYRQPVIGATDYNYVRFDVVTGGNEFFYEMVNGELKQWSE